MRPRGEIHLRLWSPQRPGGENVTDVLVTTECVSPGVTQLHPLSPFGNLRRPENDLLRHRVLVSHLWYFSMNLKIIEILFLSIRRVLIQRRRIVYVFVSLQSVYCFISIKLKWKLYPDIKLQTIHLCSIFGENNAFILSADSGEFCSAFSSLGSNPIQFSAPKLSETSCTTHFGR